MAGQLKARAEAWAPLALALGVFAIYLPRLCPTVALMGDSAVFTSAAILWGVPQPPGYPVLTLLGHLFSRLPFGDPAWRVHLTSAVFHAATVGVVARAVLRRTGSLASAAGAALCLAFSRLFFLGSLYAEAFPLNDLFTALAFAIALEVERLRAPRAPRALLAFAALAGLASAHHQMIALAAPGLALLVFPAAATELRARPSRLALYLAVFLGIAVAANALVLLAAHGDPWVNWGDVHDLGSWVHLLTRADYGGLLSPALVSGTTSGTARAALFLTSTWRAFGPVGCALALGGAWVGWRSSPRVTGALLLGVLVAGPVFALANAIPIETPHDQAFAERFFTMAHVCLAFLVGDGLLALDRVLVARKAPRWAIAVGTVALGGLPWVLHSTEANFHRDRIGEAFARDLLNGLPDRAVALFTGDASAGAAAWTCGVEGHCAGRAVFSPGQLHMPWRVAQLERRHRDLRLRVGEHVADVVDDNAAARPVLLSPGLLDREPSLRSQRAFFPEGLLLRVVDDANAEDAKTAFARSVHALSSSRVDPALGTAASALDRPLVADYATALENHARILGLLGGDSGTAATLHAGAESLGWHSPL